MENPHGSGTGYEIVASGRSQGPPQIPMRIRNLTVRKGSAAHAKSLGWDWIVLRLGIDTWVFGLRGHFVLSNFAVAY